MINELFANAALAMFEVMVNTSQIKPKIKVKGHDMPSLMFNWLNELLVFVDVENLAFSSFNVRVDEKNFSLTAECEGEEIDPERHEARTVVKACTYHSLQIRKDKTFLHE